jgi:hypothetical protein
MAYSGVTVGGAQRSVLSTRCGTSSFMQLDSHLFGIAMVYIDAQIQVQEASPPFYIVPFPNLTC